MCGIVGYIGAHDATPILLAGLKRLEYRGYDSAGIAVLNGEPLHITTCRRLGKLGELERALATEPLAGTLGIGHTRWATHGKPSEANAHPHTVGRISLVHNGIIENHRELRDELVKSGRSLLSDTDSEVAAHLIDRFVTDGAPFTDAVTRAIERLEGAYALAVMCETEPDLLIGAKHGSPLIVATGKGGAGMLASDIPAVAEWARAVLPLDDGEMVLLRRDSVTMYDAEGKVSSRPFHPAPAQGVLAEKGLYRHFMHKEIHEQPRAMMSTIEPWLTAAHDNVRAEPLPAPQREISDDLVRDAQKIFCVACGTAYYAALVGKYYLEQWTRLPVEVDYAHEFRYREPIIPANTLALAVSQSGETADTLAALQEAKSQGATTVALTNMQESSLARAADGVFYTLAGLEVGVAATKTFTTQLATLYLTALKWGRVRGHLTDDDITARVQDLVRLPSAMDAVLAQEDRLKELAQRYQHANGFIFLGRGVNYPLAMEGALKLKEISYIHAEGYAAGEMKHGPLALIDEHMPVVVLVTRGANYEKVFSNLEEAKARGGRIIALASHGDEDIARAADAVAPLPHTSPELMPILHALALQLLAYHIAVLKGTDVDQPRNLAKSVTVE